MNEAAWGNGSLGISKHSTVSANDGYRADRVRWLRSGWCGLIGQLSRVGRVIRVKLVSAEGLAPPHSAGLCAGTAPPHALYVTGVMLGCPPALSRTMLFGRFALRHYGLRESVM